MNIDEATWPEVVAHYDEMASQILRRAVSLGVPGIVLEFELLPPMTKRPEWGAEITAVLKRHLVASHEKHHLACALRVTPTDIRDQQKPPLMRTGEPWQRLKRSLELCAEAGADILSIESIGGKEVHDQALMYGDFSGIVFALGVLAPRDMSWLWAQIGEICAAHPGVVSGGDSACGFANTAMQLAHQKMLPEVLAAVVRAMSAVRSLCGLRAGRGGPVERLRLRGAGHQGHYRLPDFNGRQIGQLRAFQPARQHRRRHVRLVEQRVGAECAPALRQRSRSLYRTAGLRLPSDEYRCRDRRRRAADCATG